MRLRVYCEGCEGAIDLDHRSFAAACVVARCPECAREHALAPDAELILGRPPRLCAGCGHDHFHVRKRFPRRVGLAIVLAASLLTFAPFVPPQLFFLPLIGAALLDWALYLVLPWKMVCYVCDAEYAGAVREGLGPFDLGVASDCQRLRRRKRVAR